MRNARIKIDYQPTWYHCYNRIAGTAEDLPFKEVEKAKFVEILNRVSLLYSVKVVSYQVMSNHFHLLVYAPDEEPGAEEMCRRYEAFYEAKRILKPGSKTCRTWQARSRDISWFMRHLQQLFTMWYNRSRPVRRRGSLWAERFKNTLLEPGSATWSCWKYIENNPVRAGIVKDAADYRFGSHGVWHQRGEHPFQANVESAALPWLRSLFGVKSLAEVRDRMDKALAAKEDESAGPTVFSLGVGHRVQSWTSAKVIGSHPYLCKVMRHYRCRQAVRNHRPVCAREEATLFAWCRSRCTA